MSNEAMARARELLARACSQYGEVTPCAGKQDWEDCCTEFGGKLCLWFNTADHSTRMLVSD